GYPRPLRPSGQLLTCSGETRFRPCQSIRPRRMILSAVRGANMRRREFLGALGTVAATWPAAARAQQAGPVRRIGILMGGAEGDSQSEAGLAALTAALRQLGWTDGQNIRIDIRWAAG